MSRQSISSAGGLQAHYERMGWNYGLFVLMAEANWDREKRQYNGIRSMARILQTSDTTIGKHLKIYDEEIGRTRDVENKHQARQ